MQGDGAEALIDEIYEAAVIPDLWRGVIERLAVTTDAALGSLFTFSSHGVVRWIGTPEADALIAAFGALGKPELNTRITRGRPLTQFGFQTDYDIFSPDELAAEPFYRDFLYPRGYGWVAATGFEVPSGDTLFFSLERKRERGNFERHFVDGLNRVRPHIGRAGLLAARLGLQCAQAAAQALEAVGLPAAVLRAGGTLYAANPLFERLTPDLVRDGRERVALVDAAADALLGEALVRLRRGAGADAVQSIPLAARGGQPPMVVHVLPVRRAAHDIFSQASSILIITPVDRANVPTAEVLQGLFDLTPAEARLARAIAQGRTVAEIASLGGASEATIRTQLKSVLAKTGVNRQAQLAALLAGSALPRAR